MLLQKALLHSLVKTIKLNHNFVSMKNKQAVTTSLQVAESFEKNHADVMRSIKNLTQQNCRVKSMFAESTYVNSNVLVKHKIEK